MRNSTVFIEVLCLWCVCVTSTIAVDELQRRTKHQDNEGTDILAKEVSVSAKNDKCACMKAAESRECFSFDPKLMARSFNEALLHFQDPRIYDNGKSPAPTDSESTDDNAQAPQAVFECLDEECLQCVNLIVEELEKQAVNTATAPGKSANNDQNSNKSEQTFATKELQQKLHQTMKSKSFFQSKCDALHEQTNEFTHEVSTDSVRPPLDAKLASDAENEVSADSEDDPHSADRSPSGTKNGPLTSTEPDQINQPPRIGKEIFSGEVLDTANVLTNTKMSSPSAAQFGTNLPITAFPKATLLGLSTRMPAPAANVEDGFSGGTTNILADGSTVDSELRRMSNRSAFGSHSSLSTRSIHVSIPTANHTTNNANRNSNEKRSTSINDGIALHNANAANGNEGTLPFDFLTITDGSRSSLQDKSTSSPPRREVIGSSKDHALANGIEFFVPTKPGSTGDPAQLSSIREKRKSVRLSTAIEKTFEIDCKPRGTKVSDDDDMVALCDTCWTWAKLKPEFFPKYINQLSCDTNTRCLSGYGQCRAHIRSLSVLKNTGTEDAPEWHEATINVAQACDCQVSQDSALLDFIKN